MNMRNEDRDWLDERIAVSNYIPDDGFTAKVVSRLPKVQLNAVGLFRKRILAVTGALAICLLIVQMNSLAQGVTHVALSYSPAEAISQFLSFVQQPGVIYGGAGCVVLLGFASIPLLRRWA